MTYSCAGCRMGVSAGTGLFCLDSYPDKNVLRTPTGVCSCRQVWLLFGVIRCPLLALMINSLTSHIPKMRLVFLCGGVVEELWRSCGGVGCQFGCCFFEQVTCVLTCVLTCVFSLFVAAVWLCVLLLSFCGSRGGCGGCARAWRRLCAFRSLCLLLCL